MTSAKLGMPFVQCSRWLLCLLVVSSFTIVHPSFAQTGVSLRLVSEQIAIVPGKPFTVGLWLQHDRGYHTYWRVPGIVGVPTQMKWNLPRGWSAGELVYPEPERTLMFQIKAQGFDRDVMLRAEITPPADLKPGDSITLSGTASWMACGRSCNPGSKELNLTLPVAETAGLNEKWHKLLDEERARAELPSDAWSATASESEKTITIFLKPVSDKARLSKNQGEADKIICFTEDGRFDTGKPQTIGRHDDGSLTITLTKPDADPGDNAPKSLRVIVRNDSGWLKDGTLRSLQIAPKSVR